MEVLPFVCDDFRKARCKGVIRALIVEFKGTGLERSVSRGVGHSGVRGLLELGTKRGQLVRGSHREMLEMGIIEGGG